MNDFTIEKQYFHAGYSLIAGVDEVGRGPLAGPVVCAAVIFQRGETLVEGVDDSKKLSAKKRETLAPLIKERALAYCIQEVKEDVIDEINILQATRLCMKRAIENLSMKPEFVITDGNMTLDVDIPQKSVIKGDALVYSVAAASILAKTYRDALMKEYAKIYTSYGFERNFGYGTREHINAIKERGLCPIHRRTFTKNF